jgi:uncharacterized protein YaaW (UPF0174 family)
VDELRVALELATDEELDDLTDLLFRPKFNPLDYLNPPEVLDRVHPDRNPLDRSQWLNDLEQRFRFLAADGLTVLQGKTDRVSYRTVLLQICRYLKVPYLSSMATTDLEAEIFLALLKRSGQLDRDSLAADMADMKSVALKGGASIALSTVTRKGLTAAARHGLLRYGAIRSTVAFLGPAMWTWFLADLGWRSISTNYGRIIPMVFAIAQIRLTRGFD